eukprot:Lithocolla_globosa_v1_NODE_6361_length_1098_cov_2.378715.p4 type:complete len:108 gc:universal NODE_6361_length_1098_cov_2.378715:402-725(+)
MENNTLCLHEETKPFVAMTVKNPWRMPVFCEENKKQWSWQEDRTCPTKAWLPVKRPTVARFRSVGWSNGRPTTTAGRCQHGRWFAGSSSPKRWRRDVGTSTSPPWRD